MMLCKSEGVKYAFQKEEYGFTVVFYRHCGEGWGWSGQEDISRDISKDNVRRKEELSNVIKGTIRNNPKVTLKEIAAIAEVSSKTISRKLKEMDHIKFVGKGKNGHWEIED